MDVNSPEYKALVSGLLGKEVVFENVRKSEPVVVKKKTAKKAVQKVVEKVPEKKLVAKKGVKKVPKKEETIYLLFKTSEFANSDDYAYELDYAFRGAYRTEEAALVAAANAIADEFEEMELFDSEGDNILEENVRNAMEEQGWKIIDTNVE